MDNLSWRCDHPIIALHVPVPNNELRKWMLHLPADVQVELEHGGWFSLYNHKRKLEVTCFFTGGSSPDWWTSAESISKVLVEKGQVKAGIHEVTRRCVMSQGGIDVTKAVLDILPLSGVDRLVTGLPSKDLLQWRDMYFDSSHLSFGNVTGSDLDIAATMTDPDLSRSDFIDRMIELDAEDRL